MASTSREMVASAPDVFDVSIDPFTYPKWLVGASSIRYIGDNRPDAGSCFHHTVGIGPFRIPGVTESKEVQSTRMLKTRVPARPFIMAIAPFHLIKNAATSVVTLEEEPQLGMLNGLIRPLSDPLTRIRNHESLRRLADFVESR